MLALAQHPTPGPTHTASGGRAWCRVLGESEHEVGSLSLAHCVCAWCMLPMPLVYACACLVYVAVWLAGYVVWCGVWLWLAEYMSMAVWLAVCMALWLAGSR